ncbi:hypothetical protein A3K63_03440 [Candidatus Micrarchaeota archaeon RBG_16_49_10]|nr:MAG: hypothetical protein A3K63_03440 [Candidatus Micrarchaeota archaeon RBG_16_49_10]
MVGKHNDLSLNQKLTMEDGNMASSNSVMVRYVKGFMSQTLVIVKPDWSLCLVKGGREFNVWNLYNYDSQNDSKHLFRGLIPYTSERNARKIVDFVNSVY